MQKNHAYQTFFIFGKQADSVQCCSCSNKKKSAEKAFVHSKQELTHHASEQQVHSESACILAVSPATLTYKAKLHAQVPAAAALFMGLHKYGSS